MKTATKSRVSQEPIMVIMVIMVICNNGDNGNNGHIKAQLGDGNVLYADVALLSLGRKPYTSGLGVGLVRYGFGKQALVKINDYLQTSVENIYAVGDVTGRSMLAHVASKQEFRLWRICLVAGSQ